LIFAIAIPHPTPSRAGSILARASFTLSISLFSTQAEYSVLWSCS